MTSRSNNKNTFFFCLSAHNSPEENNTQMQINRKNEERNIDTRTVTSERVQLPLCN